MGTPWRFHAHRIVFFEEKIIVPFRVLSDLRVVVERAKGERGPATPAAHDFRRGELFVFGIGRIFLDVLSKLGHALMQLSKDYVGAVFTEDLRLCFLYAVH